jgi:hemoglobin
MSSLLERLGGEAAVKAVVDSFYDKVFADPILAPFFAKTDQAKQRQRQGRFLIQLMSGRAPQAASYMREAHSRYVTDMGLGDKEFDIVAGHLVATMKEFSVPSALIGEVGGALESLRAAVLNRDAAAAAE